MAIDLRRQGWQWEDIATACGLKGGKGAAYHLVNNALKAALRESGAALRELENQRLDALHKAYWEKAIGGDGWSHDRILRQMERRAALNGVDMPAPKEQQASALPTIREYPEGLVDAV